MATSDIGALLNQGIKLDSTREKQVCDAILNQLNDSSIDVQSIAVRTLPLLVAKSQQNQVVEICTQLCEKMLKGDDTVRDLYAIGLKTCVTNLPLHLAHPVLERVMPRLIPFIEKDTTSSAVQDALEVVNDLLGRFGAEMDASHDTLIRVAIAQLSNPNNLVRKRAIGCLGCVASDTSDSSLNKMVETILGRIDGGGPVSPRSKAKDGVVQETIFVQAIGAIGRSAGNRLGAHINRIIPLLFRHLKNADDESMENPSGDDLRENIFQGLDSFVLRCPNEMQPFLASVYEKTAEFIVFDPNFNYGGSDDDEDMGGSEEDDDDYSNFGEEDDDTSWKVRRAAAKVLNSIIISRPDALKGMFAKIQDLLQKRFVERVESVRLDILEAYKSMLEATVLTSEKQGSHDKPVLVRQRSTMEILQQNLTPVVKSLSKLLKDKSKHALKTRTTAFQVASKLVYVVNGSLDDTQLDLLLQPMIPCMADRNSTLRLEALILCKTILMTVSRMSATRCNTLKDPIIKCIQAEWFKIVAEALKCVSGLCQAVRPVQDGMFLADESTVNLDQWGSALCASIMPRLKQTDIDQEIKNAAIESAGVILSVFGDHVGLDKEKDVLQILLERTKNDSSRLFALRALEKCARSPARLSSFAVISQGLGDELAVLLRQQSRETRQQALSVYIAMVDVASFVPAKGSLEQVATELGSLIADSKDSALAHLALTLSALFITKLGKDGKIAVRDRVAAQIVSVCSSSASLLTGQAYHSLMAVFSVMASLGGEVGLGFDNLFPQLFPDRNDAHYAQLSKASTAIVAEACAVIMCNCPDAATRDATIIKLVQACWTDSVDHRDKAAVNRRLVAIIMLGEVGRRSSLAAVKQPATCDIVIQRAFEDEDEAIKVAAASSLGKLVVGDPQAFLPIVMNALEAKDNKNHYLVLVSLREVLSSDNAIAHVSGKLQTVVHALRKHCSDSNEEVRNMVAECLGKLAVLFPAAVVSDLVSVPSDSPDVKWTKVTAIRHAVVALGSLTNGQEARNVIMQAFRAAVCPHITDKDNLELCKAALMAVHALVHHNPEGAMAIFPHGEGLADVIYQSTEVREELQKKVDFGPFKVIVDDGLPLRKSAYSCLSAMLENCQDLLGSISGQLIPCVSRGLDDSPEDAPDIPFVCHQIFIQLCARYPLAVISQGATITQNFKKTLRAKLDGKDPEKQERRVSVVKSSIRALDHIAALPGALDERDIAETIMIIQKTENLKQMAMEEGLKNVFKKGTES